MFLYVKCYYKYDSTLPSKHQACAFNCFGQVLSYELLDVILQKITIMFFYENIKSKSLNNDVRK